jgi:hypothetical protein
MTVTVLNSCTGQVSFDFLTLLVSRTSMGRLLAVTPQWCIPEIERDSATVI